jgi:hypothetical protein
MDDPLVGRRGGGIEQERLERRRLAGIEELGRGKFAILDGENARRHLVLNIAGDPRAMPEAGSVVFVLLAVLSAGLAILAVLLRSRRRRGALDKTGAPPLSTGLGTPLA